MVVTLGEGNESETVLVTLSTYDGELEADSVFPLKEPAECEVIEDVDPDADDAEDVEGEGEEEAEGEVEDDDTDS